MVHASRSNEKSTDNKVNKEVGRKQSEEHKRTGYMGKDSREGRLKEISTDRGEFRFKDNRKGE